MTGVQTCALPIFCEAEIILMIREVFKGLGINGYSIRINHRDVLRGLATLAGAAGKETAFYVALDKLDKIGKDKVLEELAASGITGEQVSAVFDRIVAPGSTSHKIQDLESAFSGGSGSAGLNDIRSVLSILNGLPGQEAQLEFDLSLARGLSYYTGCIFEIGRAHV